MNDNKINKKYAIAVISLADRVREFIKREDKNLFNRFESVFSRICKKFPEIKAIYEEDNIDLKPIIEESERLSLGFEKVVYREFLKQNIQTSPLSEKLKSIFSEIKLFQDNDKELYYDIEKFNSKIVPKEDRKIQKGEVETLLNSLLSDLEIIEGKNLNIETFYNSVCFLFEIYLWCIPAAKNTPAAAISLYDLARTISAFSSVIYEQKQEGLKTEKDFRFIQGDFTGIQEFIFDEAGESNKFAAKILRAKSFFVSVSVEIAAKMVCDSLEIPVSCIVMNAGGKFTIIAPNLPKTNQEVIGIRNEINKYFHKMTFGQTQFNLVTFEFGSENLEHEKYENLLSDLAYKLECQKLCPQVEKPVFDNYDIEKAAYNLCQICGKHVGKERENNDIIMCGYCFEFKTMGEKLLKAEQINFKKNPDKTDFKVFGTRGFNFKKNETLQDQETIFSLNPEKEFKGIAVKRISKYTARFPNKPFKQEQETAYKRIKEQDKENEGDVKNFYYLAADALKLKDGKLKGRDYLGILKADIDYLGKIFSKGFKGSNSIAKTTCLSRMIDYFFTGWLQDKIKEKSIYTVFSGGDDLFLIGAWDQIIEISQSIQEHLEDYSAKNKNITISAGIILSKPMVPVRDLAEAAEESLVKAKKGENYNDCRDRINIFGITSKWKDFTKLMKIKDKLMELSSEDQEKDRLSSGFLYKLIKLSDDAGISFEDKDKSFKEKIEAAKWQSRLLYLIKRNYYKGEDICSKEAAMKFGLLNLYDGKNIINLIEYYEEQIKIPLSINLYSIRRVNG